MNNKDKIFTGCKKKYERCREYLKQVGFCVDDAIHIGNNKFEFDTFNATNLRNELGCQNTYTILAWEENGEVKYKSKVTGFICTD